MYPSTSVNGLNNEKKFLLISDSSSNLVNNSYSKPKMISNNINNHNKSSTKLNGINYNHTKSQQQSSNMMNSTTSPNNKRKKQEKTGKGLRHFSTRVCEKVRSKGTTTYNEVADELVAEFSADPKANRASFQTGNDQEPYDQKNIRRRVYDAINVLWAINIISKEKKEIKWVGLPSNAAQECSELEKERIQRLERIKKKKKQLRDILIKQIAYKNLIDLNQREGNPDPNSTIKHPFIIVNTEKNTLIDCSVSRDKSEYVLRFGSTFEIHEDIEIMKRMGLAYHLEKLEPGQSLKRCDYERALQFLPESLRPELDDMIKEKHVQILN